jgi:CheY-like chemotaxis protein
MRTWGKRLAKEKVLVVDDDADYRALVCHHLEAAGCQVFEPRDGTDAAAVACGTDIPVIVLDIVMPGTEGLETITQLHRQG